MVDVSIIMVNYKTYKMTHEAINSIYNHTSGINFEIIVVDNGSNDGSVEYLTSDNRIRIIPSEENLGFGKANNLGLKYASGRNILFLNTDTKIKDNSICLLSKYLDTHPKVGALGGNLIDGNGTPTQSFERSFPGPIHVLNALTNGLLYKILYGKNIIYCHSKEPINVAYISGADLMIPKNILKQVGSFDPDFFMYYEETDLCFRIKKAGYNARILPSSTIIHYEGGSIGGRITNFNPNRTRMLFNSRQIFITKNFTPFKRKLTNFLFTLFLYLRVLFGKENAKQMLKIYLNLSND